MKNIIKILTVTAFLSVILSSCIKETYPYSSYVTEEQAKEVPGATAGFVAALPAYLKHQDIGQSGTGVVDHWEFALPAMMLRREAMGQDLIYTSDNYNHWARWYAAGSRILGPEGITSWGSWVFYYREIYLANLVLSLVEDPLNAELETDRWNYGIAAFYKAWAYFELVRMHTTETYQTDPSALGVPLVDSRTIVTNNPRVTIEAVYTEIERLLVLAEQCLVDYTARDFTDISLQVVQGELARFYLEKGDYPEAERYAILAQVGHSVTTEEQWTNKDTGFNTNTNAWMWGTQYFSSDRAVTSGIVNWASWMGFEQSWGYSGTGTGGFVVMDAYLYSKMNDTDFRKKVIVNPTRSNLSEVSAWSGRDAMPSYANAKFRVAAGGASSYMVGACVAVPFMRVEEMKLIEAEAAGRQNLANGIAKLTEFVQTRDAAYSYTGMDERGFIEEIFIQRRLELWGEGITYFDYKRLNKGVTRWYTVGGLPSNHTDGARFNTAEQPTWMNMVIPLSEVTNNPGLGPNNPTPENPVQATTPVVL